MINVAGSSASYPSNVRLPAAGDQPNATVLGAQGQDLADRTAYLKANGYRVLVQEYTSPGSFTYVTPAGAVALDVVAVGPGDRGANGGAGIGGGGGRAGMIVQASWSGNLAAVYDVTVGSNVTAPTTPTYIRTGGQTRLVAPGGAGATLNLPSDIRFDGALQNGAVGGSGNAALAGDNGYTSLFAPGGLGGAVNTPGNGGAGFGAGGGGGRQASGSTAGGGGGGGGFLGTSGSPVAANGLGSTGGLGASGYVRFTAYVAGL